MMPSLLTLKTAKFQTVASTVSVVVPRCTQFSIKRRTSGAMQLLPAGMTDYATIPADQSFNSPSGMVSAQTIAVTLPAGDDAIELIYWQ